MGDEDKPPMPPQPKTTTELPAVPPWAIELTRSVKDGFARVDSRLDEQDVALEAVVNEGKRTNTRLTRLEERVDELEPRIGRSSSRVREESSVNLKQDAAIADLARKLDENTALSVELKGLVVGAVKSPRGQQIIGMLVALAIAGGGYALRWLQAH